MLQPNLYQHQGNFFKIDSITGFNLVIILLKKNFLLDVNHPVSLCKLCQACCWAKRKCKTAKNVQKTLKLLKRKGLTLLHLHLISLDIIPRLTKVQDWTGRRKGVGRNIVRIIPLCTCAECLKTQNGALEGSSEAQNS